MNPREALTPEGDAYRRVDGWPFARQVVREDAVESTSDLARALVEREATALPLLVLARRQTKGRGRGTNAWWSDEGSLTFTLGLDPAAHGLSVEHEPRLSLASAVAVIDALTPLAPDIRLGIRWPNDVEGDGRKLGGILPERIMTPKGSRILIGIGLNLRTSLDLAPPEVRRMAASLHELAGQEAPAPDPERILHEIIMNLECELARLAQDDPGLPRRWNDLDRLLGCVTRVDLGDRIVEGIGAGIGSDGAFLLATEHGVERLLGGRVLREILRLNQPNGPLARPSKGSRSGP